MKENKHLPVYGVGPLYGVCIILITVVCTVLSFIGRIPVFKISVLKIPLIIAGAAIIVAGFFLWFKAAFRIDKYIVSNQLCTDGVYSIVRNPCYSGIMLMCDGILLITNNLYLLILLFVYWLAMTILMKCTEEKWLFKLYGQEYADYCKKVNRCIPFPRKG